ncbi:hypothetical protein EV193_102406 [Herbihabitans rhizosphaerae]|uniref:Uncharacterized protein n=1 Tax=Herbihabitans rhizosphaerae TaxID=1872711 RepID=A0A4Q7L2I7_9PSEU|nr:hypothetical protein [Herbihabitans rhizosphaerae]RZS43427.1 hypothetical protein EV193_102406 [Herbihabitans rhizosphaerae]
MAIQKGQRFSVDFTDGELANAMAIGTAVGRQKDAGVEMVERELVKHWEAAYRAYGAASESLAQSPAGDPAATKSMASASWEVAVAWRDMVSSPDTSWWIRAAVGAAAQAFEFQAHDWQARLEQSRRSGDRLW